MNGLHQLEKLTLRDDVVLTEDFIINLNENFKGLRHLETDDLSITILKKILQHLPLLESITFVPADYDISEDSDSDLDDDTDSEDILLISNDYYNEKLKQLVVKKNRKYFENSMHEIALAKALPKVVNACPNLERIRVDCFSIKDFKQILYNNRRLTHLNVFCNTCSFGSEAIDVIVDVIETSDVRLEYLHLRELSG